MNTKVVTKSINVPRWQADLLTSLFNADGGDGFDEADILKAEKFIREKGLLSLVEAKDIDGEQVRCTFTASYAYRRLYTYVLIGEKVTGQYRSFGLLPCLGGGSRDDSLYFFRRFESEAERDAYLSGLNDGNIAEGHIVIDDAEALVNQWWDRMPDELKRTFSILPENTPESYRQFWERLFFWEKKCIHGWCTIHSRGVPVNGDDLNSLRLEVTSELADLALAYRHGKPVEELCDKEGSYLDKYQDEYNDILDDIEDKIVNFDYSNLKNK